MRQETTTPEQLSVVQIQCVQNLMAGATITAVAKAIGIDRGTIYRWLRSDAAFGTELNRLKTERLEAVQSEFRNMLSDAVATVKAILTDPNIHPGTRLRAALAVVDRTAGAQPETIGPVDLEEVQLAQSLRDESSLLSSLGRIDLPKKQPTNEVASRPAIGNSSQSKW